MEKKKTFKKGDLVKHEDKNKVGFVLECGVFHEKYKKFLCTNTEEADHVKVWAEGKTEVWAMDALELM